MALFFQQLYWELYRMFARKRTYIGLGVFLGVELLFYFILTLEKSQKGMEKFIENVAGGFEEYFSALTLAFMMMAYTMFFLATVFISLVSGDILAKETEDGNLRLILARPISRFRLMVVKFLACNIYTLVLFCFVGLTSLIVGLLDRGWGGKMFVWSFELPKVSLFEWGEGMGRYFMGVISYSAVFLPVTGVAFMFSCFKIKPATATILTIALFFADFVISTFPFPFFDPYRHFFITPKIRESWYMLFMQEIPWPGLLDHFAWLAGIGITGFLIGWIAFERRDVKS